MGAHEFHEKVLRPLRYRILIVMQYVSLGFSPRRFPLILFLPPLFFLFWLTEYQRLDPVRALASVGEDACANPGLSGKRHLPLELGFRQRPHAAPAAAQAGRHSHRTRFHVTTLRYILKTVFSLSHRP
jgi:hypothetical protein